MTAFFQYVVKIAFTAGLALLVAVAIGEAYRLWFDRTLVLASFDYVRDGTAAKEAGQDFAGRVRQDLERLVSTYKGAAASNVATTSFIPLTTNVHLDVRSSAFSDIEIEAYGVQFSTLFRAITKFAEQPNEIRGSVSERLKKVDVFAQARRGDPPREWFISQAEGVDDASYQLASAILRYLASRTFTIFDRTTDAEFVGFSHALEQYRAYQALVARGAPADQLDGALAAVAGNVDGALGTTTFALYYRLGALTAAAQRRYDLADARFKTYAKLLGEAGGRLEAGEQAFADSLAAAVQASAVAQRAATPRSVTRGLTTGTGGGASLAEYVQTLPDLLAGGQGQLPVLDGRVRGPAENGPTPGAHPGATAAAAPPLDIYPGAIIASSDGGLSGVVTLIVHPRDEPGTRLVVSARSVLPHAGARLSILARGHAVEVGTVTAPRDWIATATLDKALTIHAANRIAGQATLEVGELVPSAIGGPVAIAGPTRVSGTVESLGARIRVADADGTYREVSDAILVNVPVRAGDAGAAIVTATGSVVGVVIGSDGKGRAIAVPLRSELEHLALVAD